MARINLEKFYQDLNEKLISATCFLDDSTWVVNRRKDQEVPR